MDRKSFIKLISSTIPVVAFIPKLFAKKEPTFEENVAEALKKITKEATNTFNQEDFNRRFNEYYDRTYHPIMGEARRKLNKKLIEEFVKELGIH